MLDRHEDCTPDLSRNRRERVLLIVTSFATTTKQNNKNVFSSGSFVNALERVKQQSDHVTVVTALAAGDAAQSLSAGLDSTSHGGKHGYE